MNKLIIDTATNLLFVGLFKDGKSYTKTRIGKNDNAAYLVNFIKLLLEEHNLTMDDISEIVVGVGPGSYTGVRVSVVVAKTLAYSKNIKLKEISSLYLLSSGYNSAYALIDARRNHYFTLKHEDGKIITRDQYLYLENIDSEMILLTPETVKVDFKNVFKNAKDVSDVMMLEPNYLRKTEAENNYDQTNANK